MANSDFYRDPEQWERALDYADRRRDEEKDREAEEFLERKGEENKTLKKELDKN